MKNSEKVLILSSGLIGISILTSLVGVNEIVLGIVYLINSNYGAIYGGEPVVVNTISGKVKGFRSSWYAPSRDGRPFHEFLGIPFAQPPVGNLRFEPPVPVEHWEGVREARSYAPKCLQFDPFIQLISGDEDCLYLNIFTLKLKTKTSNPKLPVMVFIHGGLYQFGRAELFRPDYFMDEDIVLVSIHYRLGSLGFLNTGDGRVRGNMGLKDQLLALKWVKQNIEKFGGDTESITLIGESAGAASIHLHMLTAQSKGLFHKAITMSGTSLNHWAFVKKPVEQAQIYANKLSCPTNSTQEMVSCLKQTDTRDIAELFKETDDRLAPRLSIFTPTVESVQDADTFLRDSPRNILRGGQIVNKVPWLNGVNSEEGLIYCVSILLNQTCVDKMNQDWNAYAPIIFDFEDAPADARNAMSSKIKQYYLGDAKFGLSEVENLVHMFSDSSFNLGLVESAKTHSNLSHSPIYLYYYTHESDIAIAQVYFNMFGWFPLALDGLITNAYRWTKYNIFGIEEKHYGVSHADELAMLFQFPYVLGIVSPKSRDYKFSKTLVRTWAEFAKNGKPGDLEGVPSWPAVEPNKPLQYMKLSTKPEVIDEPFTTRLQFWKDLFHYKKWSF